MLEHFLDPESYAGWSLMLLMVGPSMPYRSKCRTQTNIVRVTGSRVMVEGTGRWCGFRAGCNFMYSFDDKLLELVEHCTWSVLQKVPKYLMLNYTSKAIMIMNLNTRPPVSGSRRRECTKNNLVKTQNICINF